MASPELKKAEEVCAAMTRYRSSLPLLASPKVPCSSPGGGRVSPLLRRRGGRFTAAEQAALSRRPSARSAAWQCSEMPAMRPSPAQAEEPCQAEPAPSPERHRQGLGDSRSLPCLAMPEVHHGAPGAGPPGQAADHRHSVTRSLPISFSSEAPAAPPEHPLPARVATAPAGRRPPSPPEAASLAPAGDAPSPSRRPLREARTPSRPSLHAAEPAGSGPLPQAREAAAAAPPGSAPLKRRRPLEEDVPLGEPRLPREALERFRLRLLRHAGSVHGAFAACGQACGGLGRPLGLQDMRTTLARMTGDELHDADELFAAIGAQLPDNMSPLDLMRDLLSSSPEAALWELRSHLQQHRLWPVPEWLPHALAELLPARRGHRPPKAGGQSTGRLHDPPGGAAAGAAIALRHSSEALMDLARSQALGQRRSPLDRPARGAQPRWMQCQAPGGLSPLLADLGFAPLPRPASRARLEARSASRTPSLPSRPASSCSSAVGSAVGSARLGTPQGTTRAHGAGSRAALGLSLPLSRRRRRSQEEVPAPAELREAEPPDASAAKAGPMSGHWLNHGDWFELCTLLGLSPPAARRLFELLGAPWGALSLHEMAKALDATVAPNASLPGFIMRVISEYGSLRRAFVASTLNNDRVMRLREFRGLAAAVHVSEANAERLWQVFQAGPPAAGAAAATAATPGMSTAATPSHWLTASWDWNASMTASSGAIDAALGISEDEFVKQIIRWTPVEALGDLRAQLCGRFGGLPEARRALRQHGRTTGAALSPRRLKGTLNSVGIVSCDTDVVLQATRMSRGGSHATAVTLDDLMEAIRPPQMGPSRHRDFAQEVVKSGTRGLWRQLREVRTDIEQGLPRATDRDASWAPHLLPTRGGAAGPGQAEERSRSRDGA